jgi:hypothetical protein
MFHKFSPQTKMRILTFNRLPCLYLWILTKVVLFKTVHPLKIYQNTKFQGPALTGASFASASEVCHSGMVAATA